MVQRNPNGSMVQPGATQVNITRSALKVEENELAKLSGCVGSWGWVGREGLAGFVSEWRN